MRNQDLETPAATKSQKLQDYAPSKHIYITRKSFDSINRYVFFSWLIFFLDDPIMKLCSLFSCHISVRAHLQVPSPAKIEPRRFPDE